MSDFAETRLDIGMPAQVGGPMYRTKIIRTGYEFEKRWCQQSEWLYEGDLSEILLDQDQVKYLIAFLNARQCRQQGFRFRFWADYTATATPKDLGHACTTQGVMAPLQGDGFRTVFKLLKRYSQGPHTSYKAIHKPDEVQVYINNAPVVAQYSAVSGIVAFNTPVPSGAVPTWSGTFDLPVRFDTDTIPTVQQFVQDPNDDNFYDEQLALFQVDSLPLIEMELPMPSGISMPTPALAPESAYRLEIGPAIGPTDAIGPTHNTFIKRLDSGFEKRTTYQAEPLLKGEINQSLLEDEQLEYVLCFFHCRRGRAQTFRWKYWADYQATAQETELDAFTTIQGVFEPAPNGTAKVFKFQKQYTQFGRAIRKGIQKLVQGTVTVFAGNAIATPTIDYEKGLATFATAPTTGSILTWDGEHDIEVRLDSDKAMLKSAVLNPKSIVETAASISYQFQNMAIAEILPTIPLSWNNNGEPVYEGIAAENACFFPNRITFSFSSTSEPGKTIVYFLQVNGSSRSLNSFTFNGAAAIVSSALTFGPANSGSATDPIPVSILINSEIQYRLRFKLDTPTAENKNIIINLLSTTGDSINIATARTNTSPFSPSRVSVVRVNDSNIGEQWFLANIDFLNIDVYLWLDFEQNNLKIYYSYSNQKPSTHNHIASVTSLVDL